MHWRERGSEKRAEAPEKRERVQRAITTNVTDVFISKPPGKNDEKSREGMDEENRKLRSQSTKTQKMIKQKMIKQKRRKLKGKKRSL